MISFAPPRPQPPQRRRRNATLQEMPRERPRRRRGPAATAWSQSGQSQLGQSQPRPAQRRSPAAPPQGLAVGQPQGQSQGRAQGQSQGQSIVGDRTSRTAPVPFGKASGKPQTNVKTFTKRNPLPLWLQRLLLIQRGSNLVLLILGVLTFAVYAWTVESQRRWSEAYRKLDKLRHNEPQLTVANEALKIHLGKEAEQPSSGLVEPNPGSNVIYLEPSPPRTWAAPPTPAAPPATNLPLSY